MLRGLGEFIPVMRSMCFTLALVAGYATAAEPMDCYNDESEPGTRYTSTEPELLRVTDADIVDMLMGMREGESRSVAVVEATDAMHANLDNEMSTSD